MCHSRTAYVLTVLLVASAACSGNDSSLTAGPAPRELGRYEGVNTGLDSRNASAIAAGDDRLLMFGGTSAGESGKGQNLDDGAIFDFRTRSSTPVPPWPFDAAPFQPAALWAGSEFVVVGTPCANPPPDDLVDVSCGSELQAAAYSPASNSWRLLPSPITASGEKLPQGSVLALAEGVSDGVALFRLGTYEESHVVGFEISTEAWRGYGPLLGVEADSPCFTSSYLYRLRLDGQIISGERLMPKSGAWEPVDEASLSTQSDAAAPDCVWTQAFARRYEGSELKELQLLDGTAGVWASVPVPKLQVGTLSVARFPGTWLVWPASEAGRPQILRDGDENWTTVDGAPDLDSPVRLYASEHALFVVEHNDAGIGLGFLAMSG